VNLASRLETAAQPGQILIAHETWELVNDVVHCDPAGDLVVKGFAYPVRTYAVRTTAPEPEPALVTSVAAGFSLTLDPSQMQHAEADQIRLALHRALDVIERAPARHPARCKDGRRCRNHAARRGRCEVKTPCRSTSAQPFRTVTQPPLNHSFDRVPAGGGLTHVIVGGRAEWPCESWARSS
jgi:hypothetical protein